jgi:O-methyltransferase
MPPRPTFRTIEQSPEREELLVKNLGRTLGRRLRAGYRGLIRPEAVLGPGRHVAYCGDGMATLHNSDFMESPRFSRAYNLGKSTGSWGRSDIQWRAYVAFWAAERAMGVPGDFVECGVNRGGLARGVIDYVEFERATARTFFLLDTFAGIDESMMSPSELSRGSQRFGYSDCLDDVRATFGSYANVEIVPGSIPMTLPSVQTDCVAFLSIDMNCVAPEIAAAEHFWPKLTPGGVMLLDDYGWRGHDEQKQAFDEFSEAKGVRLLRLPTGQALLFKPSHGEL